MLTSLLLATDRGSPYRVDTLATRPEPFYEALGRRVAEARERRGLTQAQLAGQLAQPVTRASIANVESGKQRVLAHTLVDLASILGVPVTDLIPGKNAKTAKRSRFDVVSELMREQIPADVAKELASAFGGPPVQPRRKR